MSAKEPTRIGHSIRWSLGIFILLLITLSTFPATAEQITLEIASVDADAVYHRIFSRQQDQAYDYNNWIYQGNQKTVALDNLQEGVVYYFVARSYSDTLQSQDSNEVSITIPFAALLDSDGDGISDQDEIDQYGTDPNNPDTDGDGVLDGAELEYWGDQWNADDDNDGVINLLDPDPSPVALEPDPGSPENPSPPMNTYLWFEAEEMVISAPMQIEVGDAQSSGDYVHVPNGTGDVYTNPESSGGSLIYQFEVPAAGRYRVWGRVQAAGDLDDSFWVSVDGGEYALWDLEWSDAWLWDPVSDRNGADYLVYELSAGNHSLTIKQREDGAKLDKVLITDDETFLPKEKGSLKMWLEAENGKISAPMQIEVGDAQSSGDYVHVPNGTGDVYTNPESSGGSLIYQFEVPAAGRYRVWGRVQAAGDLDDSFWVSVDGGEYALWDLEWSDTWLWDPVGDRNGADYLVYELSAGNHSLTIKQREDGAKLDKLLITDELGFIPDGLGDPDVSNIRIDSDNDGLLDSDEINIYGTDPTLSDSDADGLNDGLEIDAYGTEPTVADTDGDGIEDGPEILNYGTDPRIADTDGDGLNDGLEINGYGTDPKSTDSDYDGLDDGQEALTYGTNPLAADTDDDGIDDRAELLMWGAAWSDDADQDGVANLYDPDSDNDGWLDGEENENGTNPGVFDSPTMNTFLWFEAEEMDISAPMQIEIGDAQTSGDYVHVPNGTGDVYHNPKSSGGGSLVYQFEVPAAGRYRVWGRVQAAGDLDDSFWVSMDGGKYALWDLEWSDKWLWDPVSDRNKGDYVVFELSAGNHSLTIKQREDGSKLDKLLITDELEFVPSELGGPAAGPTLIWYEAEDGDIYSPIQIEAGDAMCSGDYIQVPNGTGDVYTNPESSGGSAIYKFEVPAAGRFRVWGRVLAAGDLDDSFWVSMDGGEYVLWDLEWSDTWLWDPLSDRNGADYLVYELSAGNHSLTIKQREDGAKLDKLLITDDLTYLPW